MTYCDKTGPDEYALYMNLNQLKFLAQKLRCDTSIESIKLLKAIKCEISHAEIYPTKKNSELEICRECNGTGTIRIHDLNSDKTSFEICPVCKGKRVLLKIQTIQYRQLTEKAEKQLIPYPGKVLSKTSKKLMHGDW